jgi:hypothetical protein
MAEEQVVDDDLEDDWEDIRRRPESAIVPAHIEPTNFRGQLSFTSEMIKFDMGMRFQDKVGENLTPELLNEIVSTTLAAATKKWYDVIRQTNMSGLIEVILEGQQQRMSPEELGSFLQALPKDLLQRILESEVGDSGTGMHMLLALEMNRRSGGAVYSLKAAGGSIVVTWTSPQGEVEFNLYEKYTL